MGYQAVNPFDNQAVASFEDLAGWRVVLAPERIWVPAVPDTQLLIRNNVKREMQQPPTKKM
jgi:hypothetical protein